MLINPRFTSLCALLSRQLQIAPDHERFFRKRFADISESELQGMEDLANNVVKLAGDRIDTILTDYAWLCEEQLNEELSFRRTGEYRLKSFREAYDLVYSDKKYMGRYMNGLLMTQLWWSNHYKVIDYYREKFLATNMPGFRHLEIGPGHGLFLYLAAGDPKAGPVCGWDVSETSIASTRDALRTLGLEKIPVLQLQNLFEDPAGEFDSIVFSEVLEHMEAPKAALEVICGLLSDDGRLFLNMPINSPAIDHLFNMESPEALAAFVEDAGFRIIDQGLFPATNQTLERARSKKLTISCAFIAERA
jgi:2-polyprenyl-3-methyl-5-hydroxy-6-metoxy-1,4-benzoquinol methylase